MIGGTELKMRNLLIGCFFPPIRSFDNCSPHIIMKEETRALKDLKSVGPATLKDFELIGVKTVEQLKREDPHVLYQKLDKASNGKINICCLDVFKCAIEQAKDPNLPSEKCKWFYWSKERKQPT